MTRRRLALAALGAVCALTACGPATVPAPAATAASEHGNHEATRTAGTHHCGLERWPVKTGTDSEAALIDLHVAVPATITYLTSLPAPAFLPATSRVKPVEVTVYQVTAALREFKLEADGDYHLVLADTQGETMIAEIPDPACVGASSPLLPGITAARAAFDTKYHADGTWHQAGVTVTVTGPAFFDSLHGQTGVAPNGIEIHPVLDIQFGSGP